MTCSREVSVDIVSNRLFDTFSSDRGSTGGHHQHTWGEMFINGCCTYLSPFTTLFKLYNQWSALPGCTALNRNQMRPLLIGMETNNPHSHCGPPKPIIWPPDWMSEVDRGQKVVVSHAWWCFPWNVTITALTYILHKSTDGSFFFTPKW